MRVCIVGCGAIGSLFAAHLARLGDVEVWAYEVNRAHVDAINKNGLRLTGLALRDGKHQGVAVDQLHVVPVELIQVLLEGVGRPGISPALEGEGALDRGQRHAQGRDEHR